jgi:death-on-curing protein
MEWQWVSLEAALAIHNDQLLRHGGLAGVKDLGAVESALAAPRWKFSFSDPDNSVDAADLAATYAISLARNHGFSDGNKRTA